MEQQLINALMKLFSKAGGGLLIKDLIQQIDQTSNPKVWTPAEINATVDFITSQTQNFGSAEARAMIETLQKKYNINATAHIEESKITHADLPEVSGVHGLL